MSDFIKVLTRKNSLRKQVQEISVGDIEKVIGDLSDILQEKLDEAAAREAVEQEKKAKIEEIRKAMQSAGLELGDLAEVGDSLQRKSVKAKYSIVDAQGERHEWSGRGRTPTVFKEYMESKGISKEQLPSA
ncbi:H-NS family nucleoid-associated regulatory protein [Nitrincola sp. MINF-07-Sa-05]|uniref:H-NS family histone-like protein n=1 Tax=Nitrincola salilacus TaxID=3400273 RepID=UPI0039185295